MLVLINGIPYFAERMEKDFNEYDSKNKYVYCNTYESKIGRLKFLLMIPFAGAVITANGVSDQSRSLDLVLKWKKKLILYWQGTDIVQAHELAEKGTIVRRYIDYATHFGVAPWFPEEVKSLQIDLKYVPYANVAETGNDGTYNSFKALTYLPAGAEDFYGWEYIRDLALARPELIITVVGSKGEGLDVPANVKMLGWVDAVEMKKLMCSHAVLVRLTKHDGKAFSMAQALSVGCEVIWTYPYEHCYQLARNSEALIALMDELEVKVGSRGNIPNAENIAFSRHEFDRKTVLSNLVTNIQNVINV